MRDSRAGSSSPSDALVGVMIQPPSATRTLMLPDEPKVRPREKMLAPNRQIALRAALSVRSGMNSLHWSAMTEGGIAGGLDRAAEQTNRAG
jgi:hypothetical protein